MPLQILSVIFLVLARPVPISRLVSETEMLEQPHCALVVGFQVDVPVPSVIAASRYVHVVAGVAFGFSPQLNDVGELDIVGAT